MLLPISSTLVILFIVTDICEAQLSEWTEVYPPNGTPAKSEFSGINCIFRIGLDTLESAMKVNYKSAVKIGLGKLQGHRLQFGRYFEQKKSIITTASEDQGSITYGALYSVSEEDMEHFLNVAGNLVHNVDVELIRDGNTVEILRCVIPVHPPRAYRLRYGEIQPWFMRPSEEHLQGIIQGYIETGIPEAYINNVASIPTDDSL